MPNPHLASNYSQYNECLAAVKALDSRLRLTQADTTSIRTCVQSLLDYFRSGGVAGSGAAGSLRASPEPEERAEAGADFHGATALHGQIGLLKRNLDIDPAAEHALSSASPSAHTARSHPSPSSLLTTAAGDRVQNGTGAVGVLPDRSLRLLQNHISIGRHKLPFPNPVEYTQYIDFFFNDVNACHPCVNENDFRLRSQPLVHRRGFEHVDLEFLALNYIIFALIDALLDGTPVVAPNTGSEKMPGWNWFAAAERLIGRRKTRGRASLTLIQILIFESLYHIHIDRQSDAYAVSGIACRLSIKLGLHQRHRGTPHEPLDGYTAHMRQRIFWTLYFLERRTAINCGWPYQLRDSDIDIDEPDWLNDQARDFDFWAGHAD
ncbi:hypothetical protein CALVIDRAFT_371841 [Calocera viscosa TUFC12733]|uniref:Xylanolytic transcriptional activator regulatory domain-containing protein n=1 Tax=Calocera viscosa (strain TUFC12733) TaxID=1330018 RepID=A0A167GT44_CALVF|nr:hypothetical protein CALVIDRAFT_371841 [Calocera viscosa TUFC12733]